MGICPICTLFISVCAVLFVVVCVVCMIFKFGLLFFCSFFSVLEFCMATDCMPVSPTDLEIDCDLLLVSKAYHLGQEETDWFEKPRDVRGSRHYGSSGHSSGRRSHVKHTYHDYDEPPEEDLWPQDDYGHSRSHSSSREHRHHGSGSSSRHSSSRHGDEQRSSRSSRSSKDPSMRHDSRSMSASSGKRGDSRSQGYHASDYSRDPSGHHHGQRSSRQSSHHQGSSSRKQQQDLQGQPSSRQPGSSGSRTSGGPAGQGRQSGSALPPDAQQGQRAQLQQQPQTSAARPGQQTPAGGPAAQQQPVQQQQLQAKPGQMGPAAGTTPTPAAMVRVSPDILPSPSELISPGISMVYKKKTFLKPKV